VRDVLSHEERDFTPWLADNLDLLGELLGRRLDLVAREARVGGFEADLHLQVVGEDAQVLVENQYGASDHDHLGKLLTYGAGLGATLLVWLAETIREEHRAALAWLNESTPEGVGFFGVELRFVRIAASLPAPELRVVAQPNGWQKRARQAVARAEARPWTAEDTARKDFWVAVVTATEPALPPGHEWRVGPRPRRSHVQFRIDGESRFWLTAYSSLSREVGVFCRFKGEEGLRAFHKLRHMAEAAGYVAKVDEGDLTASIEYARGADWRSEIDRPEIVAWIRDQLVRLARLVLDNLEQAPDASTAE
jgi:hypothetical protein